MDLQIITDTITLGTKRDVLKLHLHTKLQEKNLKATDSEMDVLLELYEFGGNYDESTERQFFDACITKKHRRTIDSIRNVLSKFVTDGVIIKKRKKEREINSAFLPRIDTPFIGLSYRIINAG